MNFSNTLMKQPLRFSLSFLPMTFFLWGCAEKVTYDFPPACPKVSVLPAASDYYVFNNDQTNLAHLVVKANIVSITGNCFDDPDNPTKEEKKKKKWIYPDRIDTSMRIALQIQRGPAAQERRYKIPYFIATIHNGKIVKKQMMIAEANFPDNIDQVKLESKKLLFKVPATSARTPDGYEFAIGFQLTPDQLSYNRHHFRAVHYNSY